MKRITVITGHYGSGKSTFSANLAVRYAEAGEKPTVVDMDTVNPYYRTADLGDVFEKNGVELIAPMYAGSNLDVPILNYDIPSLYSGGKNLIIDMGGDDAGTYPLGRYAGFIGQHRDETEFLYVVNFCRLLTHDESEALEILREIENACGLTADGIINNTNLGFETDNNIIADGIRKAEALSVKAGIPVVYNTVPLIEGCGDITAADPFKMNIYIRNVWQ